MLGEEVVVVLKKPSELVGFAVPGVPCQSGKSKALHTG